MKFTKKGVLALASFVLLVLQAFGLRINVPVVNEIIAAAASVLVMFGILTDSTEKSDDGELPTLPDKPTDNDELDDGNGSADEPLNDGEDEETDEGGKNAESGELDNADEPQETEAQNSDNGESQSPDNGEA